MQKFKTKNLWIYLFPALMDFSFAAIVIFSTIKVVEFGAKPFIVGLLGSVCGITYFLSSLLLSKIITRQNSFIFMITGSAGFIFLGLFFGIFYKLAYLFLLLIAAGLFAAFFFVGFQLFMEQSTGIPSFKAAALYTFSWSTGAAIGSISEGFLMGHGLMYARLPVLLPGLIIIAGILLNKKLNGKDEIIHENENIQNWKYDETDYLVEAYKKIAWIEIFTVTMVTVGIRCLLPKMAISFFGYSQSLVVLLIFTFFIIQSISGYFSSNFKFLRYNIFAHNFFKIVVSVFLLILTVFPYELVVFSFICIFGIYAGHAFYTSVYYAINHRKQAGFNVSINEGLVGIASVAGPFLFGFMLNLGVSQFLIFPLVVFAVCSYFQHKILKISQINPV